VLDIIILSLVFVNYVDIMPKLLEKL
jgi:hypothetical protein